MVEKKKLDKVTREELERKAERPAKLAESWHPFYKGKIEIIPKCKIESMQDFSVWYSPGVARSCTIIREDLDKGSTEALYTHTNKWNTVAVLSDGSRVLGLGDIGPEASIPVMEGKGMLFKYLGGVDAFPLVVDAHDPEDIIKLVKWVQPAFGGINLEDISHPKCFTILDHLRRDKEITIPVWHDDQQGTAAISLAAFYNALKLVNKKLDEVKLVVLGSGAAGIGIGRLLVAAGLKIENMIMVDSRGILEPSREDADILRSRFPEKWYFAAHSNGEGVSGGLNEAVRGADAIIATSKSQPGIISHDHISAMSDDPIVFALANPYPEIWPWDAKEAGVAVIATGRSDFPNQVNNSLVFPALFRGVLDVHAYTITDGMAIAAAKEIAKVAEEKGLSPDYIVPSMQESEVFPREAVAVAEEAMRTGIARIKKTRDELFEHATSIIQRTQNMTKLLMKEGIIPRPPVEDID